MHLGCLSEVTDLAATARNVGYQVMTLHLRHEDDPGQVHGNAG